MTVRHPNLLFPAAQKKSVTELSKSAYILSHILYDFNLSKSLLCGKVSNAFAKSVYITSICTIDEQQHCIPQNRHNTVLHLPLTGTP